MSMMCRPRSQSLPSLLDEFFREPYFMVAPMGSAQSSASLALDLSETERDVIVRASLPGFTKDQICIEVHNDVLTIQAEKSEESQETNERYHRKERRFGSTSRSIALPVPVMHEKAKAELKDGVLTLTLPKHEKAQPKKISVS
jgi:HSP20 family protein